MFCIGGVPRALTLSDREQKELFLDGYVDTYLKEEVVAEQLVRNLIPFRLFLEVAAQCNGEIVNYSKIARDIDAEDTTVKNYFDILVDTHIGFRLPAFGRSLRKQQNKAPKFYLFDLGVARALANFEVARLTEGSALFGKAFKHFVIAECLRLNHYQGTRYKFSYFRSKDGREVDLVVQQGKQKLLFVEIKSTDTIREIDLTAVRAVSSEVPGAEAWVICREARETWIDGVRVLPWQKALQELFFAEVIAITSLM